MAAKALYTDSDTMDSVSSTSALPLLTLRASFQLSERCCSCDVEARGRTHCTVVLVHHEIGMWRIAVP